MAISSNIEWTEATWNPTTGCSKISPGCMNCYAERLALRLQAAGQYNYRNGFEVTIHDSMLNLPMNWKNSKLIFVNSMSDLFHEKVPDEFILKVFKVMNQAHWHIFQILTKRSERLIKMNQYLPWAKHIWMGVSVETEQCAYRIDHLKETKAFTKFISVEPMLGPLSNLELDDVDWVIVGGESGPKARLIRKTWVMDIRDQCLKAEVPFFFKQWGGFNRKKSGRLLEGRTWSEMPATFTHMADEASRTLSAST